MACLDRCLKFRNPAAEGTSWSGQPVKCSWLTTADFSSNVYLIFLTIHSEYSCTSSKCTCTLSYTTTSESFPQYSWHLRCNQQETGATWAEIWDWSDLASFYRVRNHNNYFTPYRAHHAPEVTHCASKRAYRSKCAKTHGIKQRGKSYLEQQWIYLVHSSPKISPIRASCSRHMLS